MKKTNFFLPIVALLVTVMSLAFTKSGNNPPQKTDKLSTVWVYFDCLTQDATTDYSFENPACPNQSSLRICAKEYTVGTQVIIDGDEATIVEGEINNHLDVRYCAFP